MTLVVWEKSARNARKQSGCLRRLYKQPMKQENSRKNIYFCFTDYAKAFDCVDHNKLWKILKEMGIPDHLTYSPEKPV